MAKPRSPRVAPRADAAAEPGRVAATLADVGREAGVSAMAVSAVLNGARTSARVSEETRSRILAAAERLRYRANATARGLAAQRLNSIGLVATVSGQELNQYFLEVFHGVLQAAAAAGQNTTVFVLRNWQADAARIAGFCDGRIDGLILLAPTLAAEAAVLLPAHTPFVALHANEVLPGVPNIESDEEEGAYRMVRQMIASGHRRILHLGGPAGSLGARRRAQGYLRAHADAGLAPPEGHLLHGEFSAEWGQQGLRQWLQGRAGQPWPQAIFAASDAIALGVLETLAACGLRAPEDISVAGFDDTLVARSAHLATVRQPLREMGQRAVDLLVARIEARARGPVAEAGATAPLVMPTQLVRGRSLGPPCARPRPIAGLPPEQPAPPGSPAAPGPGAPDGPSP